MQHYGERVPDPITDNLNIIQTAVGHLAAEGLSAVGKGKLGGVVISPVTWAYNYMTQGAVPTSVDFTSWGVSLAGGLFGPVTLAASYVKAAIDDDVQRKLSEVRQTEPSRARPGILALTGWGTPSALAAEFASAGGVAWQHPNGLWVSVIDTKKRLIVDYRPMKFRAIYRPILPLQKVAGTKLFVTTDKWSR